MRLLLIVCGLVVVACPPPTDPGPEADVNIGIRGLWSNPNDLEAPRGAMLTADNIVIDRPDIAEPRRGFSALGATLTGRVNRLILYQGSIIAHHNTSSISRWTGAAWSAYSGTFNPPDSSTPPTFLDAEGSLFVTTSAGVYELDSPTGTWRKTGAPPGLDGTAVIKRTSGTSGPFTPDGQWAYRDVWVYRNASNRLQFGVPSGRMIMVNPAAVTVASGSLARSGTTVTATVTSHPYATNDVVDLTTNEANFTSGQKTITGTTSTTFTYTEAGSAVSSTIDHSFEFSTRQGTRTIRVPAEITDATGWTLQVYRSGKSASATDFPDDNMGLVVEKIPTNLEVAAGTMTVTDYAPDNLRGATLYTTTGGLVVAKDRPPVCHDIHTYGQSYWCVDTNQAHHAALTLLSVNTANGLNLGHILRLRSLVAPDHADYFNGLVYADTAENSSTGTFKLYTSGSAAQNIEDTAQSIVRVINSYSGTRSLFRAAYVSSGSDFPGQMLITALDPTRGAFTMVTGETNPPSLPVEAWSPDIARQVEVDSLSRTGSTVTATMLSSHGLVAGQQFTLEADSTPEAAFPAGTKTVASVSSSTVFTYTESGTATTGGVGYIVFDHPLAATASTNDDWSNSLHWSSPDEPWSFPVAQQTFVGGKGTTIYRVVPSGDRLLVWTSSGLYKVTGTFPYWNVTPVDLNAKIVARGTAAALGDRGFGYTNLGEVEALDTTTVRSIPIERTLRDLQATAGSTVALRAFAVAYESDRRLLLWLPTAAGDTQAKQAFVYHSDSNAWTRWPIDATTAVIDPVNDLLYLGNASGAVWVERKDRALTDFKDAAEEAITTTVEWVAQVDPVDATKFWYEGALDFKSAQFTTSTLYVASDLSPVYDAGTTLTPPLGSTTGNARIPFWVSMEKRRGARLNVKFTHAVEEETYALQGLKLQYRVTSEKAGR